MAPRVWLPVSFAVGVAAGVAVGYGGRPAAPPPPDLAGDVLVYRHSLPAEASHRFVPFRVVEDGRPRMVGTPSENPAETWSVELAGGRVVLYAREAAVTATTPE